MKSKLLFKTIKNFGLVIVFLFSFQNANAQDLTYLGFSSNPQAGLNALATPIGVNTMTLETWVYVDANVGEIAGHAGFLIGFNGWFRFVANNIAVWVDPTPWLGTWVHVACVADGTNNIVYVNGIQTGIAANAVGYDTANDESYLYLGRTIAGTAGFEGKLADFRLWSVARTAEEIAANYQASVASNSSGLLKNFTFTEGTGDHTLNLATSGGNAWFMTPVSDYTWGSATLSTDNFEFSNSISIYPTLIQGDSFQVKSENFDGSEIKIFNSLGQNVKSSTLQNVNVSGLNNGLYIVHIESSGKRTIKRIIVNRK